MKDAQHILLLVGTAKPDAPRALKEHLPKFIPGLVKDSRDTNLFMSDDIVKGSRWFDAVEIQLAKADVGVVCITREGLRSGWIHFEAGALARADSEEAPARRRAVTSICSAFAQTN